MELQWGESLLCTLYTRTSVQHGCYNMVLDSAQSRFGPQMAIKDSASYMSLVKRICVFEHSVMTNFNCPSPAIQRGQGSGFLSEGSS